MSTPATRELASIVIRLAEARVRLGRCQTAAAGARAAQNLASLMADIESFFALHGDAVPPELHDTLRQDAQTLGVTILHLAAPAGRA